MIGDLSQEKLGCEDQISELKGKIDHFFHLAAIYDMTADAESQRVANVEGTREAVKLANELEVEHFHMVSSIAAAGLYKGTFTEDMFDEAHDVENHPYFQTKHESEAVVREEAEVPWRIYRPGIVVGHSETGEMDKVDGPYYFFKLLQRARNLLPPWMPGIGIEGREINLVPVDFVAKAMDHIAHEDGLDGKVFHLTDPESAQRGPDHQPVRPLSARARGRDADRPEDARRGPEAGAQRGPDAAPGEADHRHRCSPTWGSRARCWSTSTTRPLRLDQHPGGAGGDRHLGASAAELRRHGSGTTGSATSTRTCSRTARCRARSAARP